MVSIPKTKQMVTGRKVEDDQEPIGFKGGNIEAVDDEFTYLGSLMWVQGGWMQMLMNR